MRRRWLLALAARAGLVGRPADARLAKGLSLGRLVVRVRLACSRQCWCNGVPSAALALLGNLCKLHSARTCALGAAGPGSARRVAAGLFVRAGGQSGAWAAPSVSVGLAAALCSDTGHPILEGIFFSLSAG